MSATIFDIRRKRRRGAMQVVSPTDFVLRRAGTTPLKELLAKPNISLYCLDEAARQAIFVETPPSIDVIQRSFLFQAQYSHAQRAYGASYESLQQIADERGDWWEDLTLIYSVGRCGSTLVSRMFGRIPECLSLSEPDVFTQLVGLPLTEEEIVQRLRMCTRCLWRPETGKTHLAIKYRSMGVEHGPLMMRAFPEAHCLFLYRHAESFVVSAMRAFGYRWSPLWGFDLLHRIPFARFLLRWYFSRHFEQEVRFAPFAASLTPAELVAMGPVGVLTITWVSAMQRCLAMHNARTRLLTLRYEDLLTSPEEVVEHVMTFCNVKPESVPRALEAMAEDAQHDSILARDKRRAWNLTDQHRSVIQQALNRHAIIRSPDYQLPGTLRVFPRLVSPEAQAANRRRSVG